MTNCKQLDAGAESVGFAVDQGQALLARAYSTLRVAVTQQDNGRCPALRTARAAVDHVRGGRRAPEFWKVGLLGVEDTIQ